MASSCVRCAGPMVEISLFDGDARLTMRSCSKCDHRIWLRAGSPASQADVLAAVGSSAKRRSA